MKTSILALIVAAAAFGFVSCDAPKNDLESKLNQLEKKAAEATERQHQLESELAEQKLVAELEAIERERTLIEDRRLAMENELHEQDAALTAELEERRQALAERERGSCLWNWKFLVLIHLL